MIKKNKSVTLLELMISLSVISVMVLSFYGIDNLSRNQVLNSDRRAKVQNELSYILEHMSKYVHRSIGNNIIASNRAIQAAGSGFQVRVDFNSIPTPSNFTDDAWITYSYSGSTLSVACSGTGCPFASETLSSRVTVFTPTIGDSGSSIEVDLEGLYDPAKAEERLTNPHVVMKTKMFCNSCSTN